MDTVKQTQTAFLIAAAKEPQQVQLWVKKKSGGICYLKIVRGKEVIQIDSKDPFIDLSLFPVEGYGPFTPKERLALQLAAAEEWLQAHVFSLMWTDISPPHVLLELRLFGDTPLPAGVVLQPFIEASWSALLPDELAQKEYLAIGRPKSSKPDNPFPVLRFG